MPGTEQPLANMRADKSSATRYQEIHQLRALNQPKTRGRCQERRELDQLTNSKISPGLSKLSHFETGKPLGGFPAQSASCCTTRLGYSLFVRFGSRTSHWAQRLLPHC